MTAHREPQTAHGRVGDARHGAFGAAIDRRLRAGPSPTVRRTRAEHGQWAGDLDLRWAMAAAPEPEQGVPRRQPEPRNLAWSPERICRLELASVATAAPLAALHTADVLTAWGCPHIAETAAVVVSELVTDTVRRAGRSAATPGQSHRCGTCSRPLEGPRYADLRDTQRFVLTLAKTPTSLFVEIYDLDPRPQVAGEAGSPGEGGHALSLVAAVSRTWNCYRPTGGGNVVWAELTVSRPDPGTVGSPRTRSAGPGMLRSAPVMDDRRTLRRVRDALLRLDEDEATGQQR